MPTKRPQRLERRAERVMGRATKNYNKYEALRKSVGDREPTMNESAQADKLESRVYRQTERAKKLKNKAQYIKDKKSPSMSSTTRAERNSKVGKRALMRTTRRK